MLNTDRFEEFISQYPIYEYRLVDTAEIEVRERVRIICKQECERYGTTWACPPAVGSLEECGKRIHSYPNGILFSSVAEVSDVMNMAEMLATRDAHEELTTEVAGFLKGEGFETFTLSTESCDLCEHCAYLDGKPCRFPEKMHPCNIILAEIPFCGFPWCFFARERDLLNINQNEKKTSRIS